MNDRGQYGHLIGRQQYGGCPQYVTRQQYGTYLAHAPAVGALYHSVGDRADAVKQLDLDWTALYQDLARQVGEITSDPKSPSGYHVTTQKEWDINPPDAKKVAWWKSYAKPLVNAWVKFKREQLGEHSRVSDYIAFAERWQTSWDDYVGWKTKLGTLRVEAQKLGFVINSPPPVELPTTVWTDVAEGAGALKKGVEESWKFVKYAAWAMLGIGAVVALSSVAQNMRAGRDPAEKYVKMIRSSSRGAAGVVLPGPVRRALSPGEA